MPVTAPVAAVPAVAESSLQMLGFELEVVHRIRERLRGRGLIVLAGGNSVRRRYVLHAVTDDLLREGRKLVRADRQTRPTECVIIAGEPSGADLCAAAVAAALRGHLAIITLPADDAAGAHRILAACGPGVDATADVVRCVITVHWVRRLCRSCAEPIGRMSTRERVLAYRYAMAPLFRSAGCDRCCSTGFCGEIPLVHFTDSPPNPADEDHTLDAAADLVRRGETTIEELARVLGRPKRQRSSF